MKMTHKLLTSLMIAALFAPLSLSVGCDAGDEGAYEEPVGDVEMGEEEVIVVDEEEEIVE